MKRKGTNKRVDRKVFAKTANRTRAVNSFHGRGMQRGGNRF